MATIPVGALTTPLLVHLPPHYAGLLGCRWRRSAASSSSSR